MRIQKVSFTLKGLRVLLTSVIVVWACSSASIAQEFIACYPSLDYDGGVFKRKGYSFEMGKPRIDTIIVQDPINGEIIVKNFPGNPLPTSVNGLKVYNKYTEKLTPPKAKMGALSIEDYLLQNLKDEFIPFSNDVSAFRIDLSNVIVDDKGKVAYYECRKVNCYMADGTERTCANVISAKLNKLLSDMPAMIPAMKAGKPVAGYTAVYLKKYRIEVKDQQATYRIEGPDMNGQYH
ncbi:MAG: hypothetical protein K9G49_05730 [Taibaiella sp.]|nr:hypothetical protein [Taibaiella sp.]